MVLVTAPEREATAPEMGFEAPSSMYQSLCLILGNVSVVDADGGGEVQFEALQLEEVVVDQC